MRTLVVLAGIVGAILLFLLAGATANTALFAQSYPLLIGLNLAIALALLVLVVVQLRGLWAEYREHRFGSRLKLRLMALFALMAILPGLMIYGVSVQFALRSIESWFDVRVDAALEGGLNLGRATLDFLLEDLATKARYIALDLADADQRSAQQLDRLREQAGVDSATLFAASGQVVASSSAKFSALMPELPGSTLLRRARLGSGYRAVEGDAAAGFTLRVLVPVSGLAFTTEPRVLQLTQPVPQQLAQNAEAVQSVYRDYQELSLARQGLRRIFALTLTLTLLLALFTAIAIAFVLARRLSAPLAILAEATQAVAQGDFTPRAALPARDELGVLTQSFNRMTRQLQEARAQADASRAEVEAARTYLESVLANLSAGVLAFDGEGRLRAANGGALQILRDDLSGFEQLQLHEWPRFTELRDTLREAFADDASAAQGTTDWQRQLDMRDADGIGQTLLVRVTRLPEAGGGGFVVVFDDITHLIAAQRSAAWGEVAQRLAHEIKNPLTPIQLSAERLEAKLSDKVDPASREILGRATRTIVAQVEAMKSMVNDFRDYARLPMPTLAPLDLNALVREVLALYEHGIARVQFVADRELRPVVGDATQMRQVMHNLLRNAEDALQGQEDPQIRLSTRGDGRFAELKLTDNGSGFPPHILARAFEPYVTTKAKGTGLGLAIVRKIVDEHHGSIEISNLQPHGAEVKIRLPLVA